jgi:hypothetical protein
MFLNKPTNQQTNKPTNQQTNKPTNQQTNKPTLGRFLFGTTRKRQGILTYVLGIYCNFDHIFDQIMDIVGFVGFVGLLVCWFVGLLVCWFVGLLVCHQTHIIDIFVIVDQMINYAYRGAFFLEPQEKFKKPSTEATEKETVIQASEEVKSAKIAEVPGAAGPAPSTEATEKETVIQASEEVKSAKIAEVPGAAGPAPSDYANATEPVVELKTEFTARYKKRPRSTNEPCNIRGKCAVCGSMQRVPAVNDRTMQ